MITSHEIRIGNILIDTSDRVVTVHGIQPNWEEVEVKYTSGGGIYPIDVTYMRPVPLSPGWLQQAGFEKKDKLEIWNRSDMCLLYNSKFDVFKLIVNHEYETGIPFKYVHSLQNLYYCLHGQELEFKQLNSDQVQQNTAMKIIAIVKEKGVVAEFKYKYWGIQHQNGYYKLWGYGSIEQAYLANPKFYKTPQDISKTNLTNPKELTEAKLENIVKITTYYQVL